MDILDKLKQFGPKFPYKDAADEIESLRRQLAADCAGNINPERGPFSRDHNNGLQHAIDIIRELKERK